MSSTGVEPVLRASEARVLSIELRGQKLAHFVFLYNTIVFNKAINSINNKKPPAKLRLFYLHISSAQEKTMYGFCGF